MGAKYIGVYKPGHTHKHLDRSMTYEELREDLGGYLEVLRVSDIFVVVDDEGRIKGLPPTCSVFGLVLCGPVYVGMFDDDGLHPIKEEVLKRFEDNVRWYY